MSAARVVSLALIAFVVAGCTLGGGGSTSSSTAPSQTIATETLTGTVPAAVNGAPQSSFNTFSVGQGGGTVSVTLTSAVETLPGGSQNSSVAMGMTVGSVTGAACTPPAGSAPSILNAGAAATLSGTLGVGTYCVLITDVTIQPGPVAYTVVVQHP
jgi:hypothetical protein